MKELGIIHNLKPEIQTELLMKIFAISYISPNL